MAPISMPRADLEAGIQIARRNAMRLAKDARVLLSTTGSRESVYGLWHLAVEELGKAELLRQNGTTPDDPVSVPRSSITDHETKFALGFALLPLSKTRPINQVVRVFMNCAREAKTVTLDNGLVLLLPSAITGDFQDTTHGGLMPAHDLRLRLLYTDYVNGRWRDPSQDLSDTEIRAQTTLSSDDLKDALDEIIQVLA